MCDQLQLYNTKGYSLHNKTWQQVCCQIVKLPIPYSFGIFESCIRIFTDQQTASAMSCAGNPDLHTPNLDRLAAAGVMFNNAYCTAPLSGPSRGAMFTGHYPDAVGLSVNGSPIPDSLRTQTLGTLIKNAGYDCAYGGKWHLPLLDVPDKEYGFDNIYKHSDDGLAEACAEYLSRKHKKPFFLVASYDNPHNICEYACYQCYSTNECHHLSNQSLLCCHTTIFLKTSFVMSAAKVCRF